MADTGEWLGDALLNEPEEMQAYLSRLMMARGANPYRNIYAKRIADQANQAQYLGNLFQAGEGGIANFAQQWLNARMGGGGDTGGLNRAGIQQRLQGILGNNDPNNPVWQLLNTGDPEADFKHLAAIRGIMTQGQGNMLQGAQQRTLQDWFQQARGGIQAGGADRQHATSWTGIWVGRRPRPAPRRRRPGAPRPRAAPGAAGSTAAAAGPEPDHDPDAGRPGQWAPTGYGAGATPTAATPTPFSVTGGGYGQSAAGPQGSLTPPVNQGAAGGGVGNWNQLLEKYRQDQRNWGTEGFRPNPGAFNIGGMAYNPNQDTTRSWQNMSGSGRETSRGNFMGQFLYTLQQYMDQRNRGGNAAIGLTPNMTDDQVARLAWQRLQRNIGSQGSGFSAA